ncbi:sensor histidine kinase [Streptomyces sp. Ru87]|uniref:sensor histidine kinase n=1 Tax=Streptomyces sp. Ru87 TaxID=2044307 RepID=UPI000BF464C4|nr:sensor histidine kinase [Streptomyces sp. Ru87]PGH47525.1 anti-sigma regulatory factor [Streptomyces sp. Ru87]
MKEQLNNPGIPLPREADPFDHPAFFYSGEQEYVAGTVPYLLDGLAAGDPVAVAVPGPQLELLRSALGGRASEVRMLDMTQAGRNPGRIIPGVLRSFADAAPAGTRPRIIGEPIWAGRSATEYPACVQHEALINLAFEGRTVSILCPYDAARLPETVLADARATHPVLRDAASERPSDAYAVERMIRRYNEPFPPPVEAVSLKFSSEDLPEARILASDEARRAGLDRSRVTDLELAVSELATNTVLHGGGSGTLHAWTEDGHFVCEVRDRGHISDPLAGRRPVDPAAVGGRGILMVNQVADLVRVHTSVTGTAVRVYFALPTPQDGPGTAAAARGR